MQLSDFWAKTENYNEEHILVRPYVPLLVHLIDTANVAYELLKDSTIAQVVYNLQELTGLKEEQIVNFICYVVGLHDIGKLHPYFQGQDAVMLEKLQDEKLTREHSGKFRHEYYSKILCYKYIKKHIEVDRDILDGVCDVVSKHHYKGNVTNSTKENLKSQQTLLLKWEKWQDEAEAFLHNLYPIEGIVLEECENIDAFCMQFLGVLVVADWIASGNHFFANSKKYNEVNGCIDSYLDWSKKVAKSSLIKKGLKNIGVLPNTLQFEDIDKHIRKDRLRPIQKEVVNYFDTVKENVPSFMIVEAPMGEGKTELALYSASRMGKGRRGIYFALPTSATSNQMYSRISNLYENLNLKDVNLLHAMNWLVLGEAEKTTNSSLSDWMTSTRTGMLGASAVGTVDQAMLSVMQVRFGVLRLLGLVGKVLIIDEIHSYDAYMQSILEVLLKWCAILKIPVIMLSATLQHGMRQKFVKAYTGKELDCVSNEYPLVTVNTMQFSCNDVYIKRKIKLDKRFSYADLDSMLSALQPIKKDGGCVVAIMNTVSAAQELYVKVKNDFKGTDVEVFLFHARMKAGIKKKLEARCKNNFGKGANRPKKAILIATQVVEQSLDLDFDWTLTETCPIDLLLQRIGRLHRHFETVRPSWLVNPTITVFMSGEDNWGMLEKVYAPFILKRTEEILENVEIIDIPNDIRELVETVYADFDTDVQKTELKRYFEYKFEAQQRESMGKSFALGEPDCFEFSLSKSNFLELDEDDGSSSYNIASTRDGLPSRLCAFIEEKELKEMGYINLSENPTKEQAEKVLNNSLTVYTSNLIQTVKEGYQEPCEGVGLLKGCLIYPTKGNKVFLEDTKIIGYELSDEFGLLIHKKKK